MSKKKKEEIFDLNKLMTIQSYSNIHGITRQGVHYRIKQRQLETKVIDGITFIVKFDI